MHLVRVSSDQCRKRLVLQGNAQTPTLHFPTFAMRDGWWAFHRWIVVFSVHLYSRLSFHFLRSWGNKFSSLPSSFMHGFLVIWDLNSKNEKYPFPAWNLTMRFYEHFKVMHLTSSWTLVWCQNSLRVCWWHHRDCAYTASVRPLAFLCHLRRTIALK